MKRVISAILVLVMVLSLMPALTMEAKAEETDVYTLVEQQIKAYSESIDQNDAAKTAATALLTNAAFRAKDLTFDESNAMTAMVFNSALFQDVLINALTNSAEFMRQQNLDTVFCSGGAEWRVYSANYSVSARSGRDTSDWTNWLGTITTSTAVYPDMAQLLNNYNENDRMLVMLVGGMHLEYTITRQTMKEVSVVYQVDITFSDDFDFNGEYDETNYNRDFEQLLTAFGQLSLKPFQWEGSASLQVEVPYSCGHSAGSY